LSEENELLEARLVKAVTYSSRMFHGVAQFYYGLRQVSGLNDGEQVSLILEDGKVVPNVYVTKASETEPVLYSNVPDLEHAAAQQMLEGKTVQNPVDHSPRSVLQ